MEPTKRKPKSNVHSEKELQDFEFQINLKRVAFIRSAAFEVTGAPHGDSQFNSTY